MSVTLLQVDVDVDPARLAELGPLMEVDPVVWIIAGVVLLVLLGLLLLALGRRRKRREDLRQRFGAEYDRAVKRGKSRKQVEEDLEARWQRVKGYRLRPLAVEERDELKSRWEDVQATFVDSPDTAMRQADTLLDEASRSRGYPDANHERRLDDLSVEHPEQVAAYREARGVLSGKDRPTTDQQREAFLKLRALFDAVVEKGEPERHSAAEPPPTYTDPGTPAPDVPGVDVAGSPTTSPTTARADAAPGTSPVDTPPAAPHPADPAEPANANPEAPPAETRP